MEEKVGTELIVRKKGQRSVELTPRGHQFLILARQQEVLNKEMIGIAKAPEIHELSIGAVDLLNCWTLREFYQGLLKDVKNLRLDIHTRHSNEMYAQMESHAFDLAYAASLRQAKNLIITPLYQEPMLI